MNQAQLAEQEVFFIVKCSNCRTSYGGTHSCSGSKSLSLYGHEKVPETLLQMHDDNMWQHVKSLIGWLGMW